MTAVGYIYGTNRIQHIKDWKHWPKVIWITQQQIYMQYLHKLKIKFLTWIGLELWHSGLWVQNLANLPQNSSKFQFLLWPQWQTGKKDSALTILSARVQVPFTLEIQYFLANKIGEHKWGNRFRNYKFLKEKKLGPSKENTRF